MLKDIRKINITGASFTKNTDFDFFNPYEGNKVKTTKGALLYGRNGAGKSTIARAIRKIAGDDVPIIKSAMFYDDAEQPIILSEEDKKHIFVFDEDYVDSNVRLKQDHLETIVMLGQAADLTDKIEKAESEKEKAQSAFSRQESIYYEYCDQMNPKSPQYYVNQLRNVLRGDDNWAGRDRKINSGRQNTGVRDDTYKKFIDLVPPKKRSDLIIEFEEQMKALEIAKSGSSKIDAKVPSLPKSYKHLCFIDK